MSNTDPRVGPIAAAHEAAVRAVEAVDALRQLVGATAGRRDLRLIEGAEIAAMNYLAAAQQLARIVAP